MSTGHAPGLAAPRAGGDMPELDIDELALTPEHRADPLVVRFAQLCDRTTRAEKVSDPKEWTPAERAADQSEDWETFSRLRGYSKEDIADFRAYLEAAADVATKYGIDVACSIDYLVHRHFGSS
ncbi:hypothetical protein ACFPOU_08370 [Massilia jejuensis]|uniref:Uncharacterized protein n=1 Tax=Massilia jejuensis TaxID=648894 RepID=A0ABW0PER4_9BURK